MTTFTSPPPSPLNAGPWKVLLLAFCSLIALAVSFILLQPPQPHSSWSLEVSVVSLITLGGFGLFSFLIFRTPYLLTSAYLLALSLFHLGVTIPTAFGLMEVAGWDSTSFIKWLEQAGWYTVLALACIGAGFSLSVTPSRLRAMRQDVDPEDERRVLSLAFRDGIGLLLVSGAMFGLAIASFGNLLAYSRVDFFRGAGDTRGLGVFLMIFPSALTLLVIGAQTRLQQLFAWTLFFFGTALIMLSGYRTAALYPMLIGVVAWVKVGRRIPTLFAAGSLVVIILAISAVGILRTHKYQDMDSAKLTQSVASANSADTLHTLGQTGGLLAHVIRLVPNTDPYRYGETYLQYIAASIPNFSMSMNQSAREIALREISKDPTAITRTIPSDWLTYRLIPEKFKIGEGVGFTGIGEPYLNFGLPGVVIFFLLLGYGLGRLDQANVFQHPALLIFISAILWHLVQTVRDDFGNFIKPMVFTYLIIWAWRILCRALFKSPLSQPHITQFHTMAQGKQG